MPSNPLIRSSVLLTLFAVAPLGASPPIPQDVPVLTIGSPEIDGGAAVKHTAVFSMGRAGKEGPLELGAKITAGALQESVLEEVTADGRRVLRRTNRVRRVGSDQVLAEASIDMDPVTLRPISARTVQGGQTTTYDYDWQAYEVVSSAGAEGIGMDLQMLEVGAHDVWMAALPLREGFRARIPAIFGSTGTKYWAVPHVVGSEEIDIGDGTPRDAWIVELDWWGMGAANTDENYSTGGGENGTGGTGGKYWVLKEPVAGTPRVVRVRTQIDEQTDSVVQLQGDG